MKNIKYIFPNLLTLMNLFCGSLAIVFLFEDQMFRASYFILAAAFFDLLDGLVARLLKATSEFGKELDSLSDLVSFGIAPSVLLYQVLILCTQSLGEDSINHLNGMLISERIIHFGAFLFAMAAALRLARFNTTKSETTDFVGMPVPAATLTVVAYFWAMMVTKNSVLHELLWNEYVVYALVLLTSFLMLSRIKMISFKFEAGGVVPNIFKYILLAVVVVLVLVFKRQALFPAMLSYISLSLISSSPIFQVKKN